MLARLLSRIAIVFFLLLVTLFGACVAGVCLAEPDTCFLLALGRWMVQHLQIPVSDPFSFTFALSGQPLVVYQWLTEVLFYGTVNVAGPVGLAVLTAGLLTIAFVIVPLRICQKAKTPPLAAMVLVSLGILSALRHSSARPELFSYVFLAVTLELAASLWQRQQTQIQSASADVPKRPAWQLALSIAIMSALWSNLHTGFVSGILLIVACLLAALVDRYLLNLPAAMPAVRSWAFALPAAIVASLVNPYFVGLWTYLPNLFFAPINSTINELKGMTLASLAAPLVLPFTVLMLLCLAAAFDALRSQRLKLVGSLTFILVAVALYLPFRAARLITFSALLLMVAAAMLLGARRSLVPAGQNLLGRIEGQLKSAFQPSSVSWSLGTLTFSCIGAALLSIFIVPAKLPMRTAAFHSPERAIEYLRQNWHGGRILNDPHFGDVMMWHMNPCPPLYIDSRYDIYSQTVQDDYWRMVRSTSDAASLLESYNIEWIMLPPSAPLSSSLKKDRDWMLVHEDEEATILRRRS